MKLRNMATIYILHGDQVLLLYRTGSRVFSGSLWCGVGGHFENEELNDAKACVLRELYEEAGITAEQLEDLRLKYITMRKKDAEIRQQYIFFAHMPNQAQPLSACSEGELAWVGVDTLPGRAMSYTNEASLRHYFAGGRQDDFVYVGAVSSDARQPHMHFTPLGDFDVCY